MALNTEIKIAFALAAVGGALLFVAWWSNRNSGNGSGSVVSDVAGGVASGVTSTVLNGAVGAAGGVVLGIGDVIGVPRTDPTECDKAIADGRTWDASFACPAGRFLKSLAGGN